MTLTGLLPGTRYYYRLMTNGVRWRRPTRPTSQTLQTTADPADVFFTVIGDWGQSGSSGAGNVANLQNAADPPLILTVGDNAYQNGTQCDWDNNALAPPTRTAARRALFMPALGNHDLNDAGGQQLGLLVRDQDLQHPDNAPAGSERYYSFDHGDAHFIVARRNNCRDAHADATGSTTTSPPRRASGSSSSSTTRPYSCANGFASIGSDSPSATAGARIFEQYGVDIVFTGHDHIYESSQLVDDFLVGGGGGSDGKSTATS